MNVGSLMRIVRSKNYEKISDDLQEVEKIKQLVPELSGY